MLSPPLLVLQAAKHVKHILGMDEAAPCNVHFGSNSHELVGRYRAAKGGVPHGTGLYTWLHCSLVALKQLDAHGI